MINKVNKKLIKHEKNLRKQTYKVYIKLEMNKNFLCTKKKEISKLYLKKYFFTLTSMI